MNTVTEKQRLSQSIFLWVMLVVIIIAEVSIMILSRSHSEIDLAPMFALGGIIALVFLIAFSCQLETRYSPNGIEYRYFPFHFKFRNIPVAEIQSVDIRTYRPILEFGGWGIRGFKRNRAFNVSGNKGVQLILKNGNRVLFGTRDPEQLTNVIMQMKRNIK